MGPTTKLRIIDFTSHANASRSELEAQVDIPNLAALKVTGAFDSANHMLSMAGFFEDEQIFLFSCVWDRIAPYFGINLRDVGFLNFYFSRSTP